MFVNKQKIEPPFVFFQFPFIIGQDSPESVQDHPLTIPYNLLGYLGQEKICTTAPSPSSCRSSAMNRSDHAPYLRCSPFLRPSMISYSSHTLVRTTTFLPGRRTVMGLPSLSCVVTGTDPLTTFW